MIDTDKYEGITPERWTVDEEDPCRVVDAQECTIARTDFVDIDEEREWQLANAQLIADAPLLLAEVERLRKENDELHAQRVQFSWIQEARGGQSNAFELLAEVKRLREGIEQALEAMSCYTNIGIYNSSWNILKELIE